MSAVNYSVRGAGGTVSYGKTSPESGNFIPFYSGAQISLNLTPQDVQSYTRSGENLVVELKNGQTVTIQGYFYDNGRDPELLLSSHGEIQHVDLGGQVDDQYLVSYSDVDTGSADGKWNAYEQMVFLNLERVEPVVAPLVAPLIGGFGGAAAAGAAVIGGGVLASQVIGGGGGGREATPTVDNAGGTHTAGGTTTGEFTITGTGEPGASVTVVIGGIERTTTINEGGTWTVTYLPSDLPGDNIYVTNVTIINPGGETHVLTGPSIDIDFTPPSVSVTTGTVTVGDIVNGDDQQSGHVVGGTGEAGATISVVINGHTQTTTVGANGTWSVTFAQGVLIEGEYTVNVNVTATDLRGNTTVITDTIQVDTVAPNINMQTIEGDNIINAAEASDGVTLNGAGEPGATLSVTFQGVTTSTVVSAAGTWSLYFSPGQIQAGTYDSSVKLTATDAAGNSTVTTYTLRVDTEGNVTLDTPISGDGVLNEAEALQGLTLTGSAEAGSSVQVSFEGVTRTVRAGTDGSWSATFRSTEIRAGEYDANVTVTSTDSVGNTSTASSVVRVDTTTQLTVNTPIAQDNIINEAEAIGGVTLVGTAEAGSQVVVQLAGATQTITAGLNGRWSATFTSRDIQAGTYETKAIVTSTDQAGNTATSTTTVLVDTAAAVAIDTPLAGGDNILTKAEENAGLTITGTGDAGAAVEVTIEGVKHTTTVAQNGTWSVNFASGELRAGEYDTNVIVGIKDAAGNVNMASAALRVDTTVAATIQVQDVTIGGDNSVNASEMANGLVLNGTADPGATVSVKVEGVTRTATAGSDGKWTVTYEPGSLRQGEYDTTATVTTTDAVGNTATSSVDFRVDTEVPNPIVKRVSLSDDDVVGIAVDGLNQDYTITALHSNGTSNTLNPTKGNFAGNTLYDFNSTVPDGSHLVISSQDSAGNVSDTMVVFDANATTAETLGHARAGNFQIEAIELDYASNANLTLTENQIRDLANGSDTLTIHGGSDDQVTVRGATRTGTTQRIDNENYDVYTIGDDGVTVVIDQDINVII